MADKPTKNIIDYAVDDTTLESTGKANKVIPTSAQQITGLDKGQTFFVEHYNYIMNNFSEWLQYLEDRTDEAGTVFEYDVQTSSTDNTTNAILKVGAFGLGSSAIPVISDVDDATMSTGIYRPASLANGDLPSSNAGSILIHVNSTADIKSQMFFASNSGVQRTYRRNYSSEAWGDWVELLDTGNAEAGMVSVDDLSSLGVTNGTVQSALESLGTIATLDDNHNNLSGRSSLECHPASSITTTAIDNLETADSDVQSVLESLGTAATSTKQETLTDSTDEALMQVGAFGLGGVAHSLTDWDDTTTRTGFYKPNESATGTAPTDASGSFLIHIRTSDTMCTQMCLESGNGDQRTYRRNHISGTWSDWVELYDSGNINEAYTPSATAATTQSVTLPNGLIMKFGVLSADDISAAGNVNAAYTITFDTPFPNGVISPTVSTIYLRDSVGGQKESMACISEYDVSSLTVYSQWVGDNDGTFQQNDISWCVIGY